MGVFHQIGHDSINLVGETHLEQFEGMVCSPLNYTEESIAAQIESISRPFLSVLDPQLYYPSSNKGQLTSWDYYPSDFDSADQSNPKWWEGICDSLVESCQKIGCDSVCSPCVVPNRFSYGYYSFYVGIGNYLKALADKTGIGYHQTAIIDYDGIKDNGEAEIVASILSQTDGSSIYLIIKSQIEPRRELSDEASLFSIMKLIRLLTDSGLQVFVAFCSSEFILWKYAGAQDFATGKFFNLRRFSSSRFDDPAGGGGQLSYWFEKNLMAYLREGDLLRVGKANLIHPDYQQNPYSMEILTQLEEAPELAWLGLSWRNYLYAFADLCSRLPNLEDISTLLKNAEKSWKVLEDQDILMEEIRNDGTWIRKWRIAISEFNKAFS